MTPRAEVAGGDSPLVSIVIPHWRGAEILLRCLQALSETEYPAIEILIVDNGSDDGSIEQARNEFPGLKVIKTGRNLGYAGGGNAGLDQATGKYAVLMNNDTVPASDWLSRLVAAMEQDESIACCQPKLLSVSAPDRFDYAGAAGGYLDLLGYPFCRGRIFDTLETDRGQYDTETDIFWASGACCMIRTSVLRSTGLLDIDFFAHMEEIDLNWRMHRAGFRVIAVPSAVVYHQAGSSLHASSPQKTYLNHRNGLLILLNNLPGRRLLWILPIRIAMDWLALLRECAGGRWRHAWGIIRAHASLVISTGSILLKRRRRRKSGHLEAVDMKRKFYRRSVVWDYFVLKKRHFSQLEIDRATS